MFLGLFFSCRTGSSGTLKVGFDICRYTFSSDLSSCKSVEAFLKGSGDVTLGSMFRLLLDYLGYCNAYYAFYAYYTLYCYLRAPYLLSYSDIGIDMTWASLMPSSFLNFSCS
jgi:hypothetical protein